MAVPNGTVQRIEVQIVDGTSFDGDLADVIVAGVVWVSATGQSRYPGLPVAIDATDGAAFLDIMATSVADLYTMATTP